MPTDGSNCGIGLVHSELLQYKLIEQSLLAGLLYYVIKSLLARLYGLESFQFTLSANKGRRQRIPEPDIGQTALACSPILFKVFIIIF